MENLFNELINIAETYDVSTSENSLVLYSVSFLPSTENRDNAFNFINRHPKSMTIENTPCGKKLVEMGITSPDIGLTTEQIMHIWTIASRRMIKSAKGKITAFVNNADPRSVFCRIELPEILNNPNINSINNEDKYSFAQKLTK